MKRLLICGCCPTCGHPRLAIGDLYFTSMQRRLLEIIDHHGRAGIRSDRLVDAVYAVRSDGGPITATNCVRAQLCRINVQLKSIGLRVECFPKGGRCKYEFGFYRLTEVKHVSNHPRRGDPNHPWLSNRHRTNARAA